jgi:hypothetical protein
LPRIPIGYLIIILIGSVANNCIEKRRYFMIAGRIQGSIENKPVRGTQRNK